MRLVRPFAAYLPVPEMAASVVSPPLGGMTTREWLRLSERNPHSFLHVIRTEVDTEEGGSDPYLHATTGKARLVAMIEDGVLRSVEGPAYYVYAIDENGTVAVGLVAEVHVGGYADGRVRRHEDTRRATEELLLSHLTRVGAHSDPVALTHRDDEQLATLVATIRTARAPDLQFTGSDGAEQEVWVVSDPDTISALQARLDVIERLYVTDGHHRCAAAARYATQAAASNPDHDGAESYNYVLAALYPESELTLREFNRCVRSDEITPAEIVEAVAGLVPLETLDDGDDPAPTAPGEVGLVTGGRTFRFGLPQAEGETSAAARLDVARLQDAVLRPVFGITDPRTDHRLHYVAGGEPADPAHHHCVACFLLYPTSVREVMTVADAGEVMPPKSTWFEPKARGGLFVTLLPDVPPG